MFPELLQDDFTPERLAHEVLSLIQDPERIKAVRRGLATVIRRLGRPGGLRPGRPGGGGIDGFKK